MLYTNSAIYSSFYNGRISVCIHGSGADIRGLSEIAGINLFTIDRTKEGLAILPLSGKADGELIELTPPPSGEVLFWSLDKQSLPLLSKLVDELNDKFKHSRFSAGSGDVFALQSKVIEMLLLDVSNYVRRSSDLNNALSQLRQEHEITRKVLQSMQDMLWGIRGNPPRMNSFTKLGPDRISLQDLKKQEADSFTQKLLVPSKGLAGVDVYIVDGCDNPGYLNAELCITATGERVASWKIKYPDITPGWLHLPLSTILSLNYPRVDLKISFSSVYDDSPTLGLTDESVISPTFIQINGRVQSGKMLSMRTWAGFPGIRNESAASHLLGADNSHFFEYQLSTSALSKLKLSTDVSADFACLSIAPDGVILLHPLRNIEMSAFASSILPKGFRHIEAEVIVNGDCPSKIEFAIAALPSHVNPKTVTAISKECVGTSGWVAVSKNFSRELIGFTLAEPYFAGELDLYLFTRAPNGQSVDFAQANFSNLKIIVDINKAMPAKDVAIAEPSDISKEEIIRLSTLMTPIARQTLATIKPLYNFQLDFNPFKFIPDKGFMLHPVSGAINVAMIPLAIPLGTTKIAVDISVVKSCISKVKFGISVPKKSSKFKKNVKFNPFDEDTMDTKTQILSAGRGSDCIIFTLPAPLTIETDIYFFTILEDGGSMNFASSYFENIRFLIGSASS